MDVVEKWDLRFLDIAKQIASWSKDPSSKLGAVAVKDRRIVATGYNGFPVGVYDSESRYNDRETKLKFVVHAEMNCIYNAAKNGVSLEDATLYIDGIACCSECAKGVIQSGVGRVVMRYKPMKSGWAESFEITKQMFREAHVEFECYEVSSPVRGTEPSGSSSRGETPEVSDIQEARGVGRRIGSRGDILRELSAGSGSGDDGQRPVGLA